MYYKRGRNSEKSPSKLKFLRPLILLMKYKLNLEGLYIDTKILKTDLKCSPIDFFFWGWGGGAHYVPP